jgi:tRNA G46 methylase TrmB
MKANSREINSTQPGVHDKLNEYVLRYRRAVNQRPMQAHTQAAFAQASSWLGDWQGDIIIDSCCGVGESTAKLALRYPEARVLGVDKSAMRLEKHSHYASDQSNYCMIRADVNDFWRLVVQANWQVKKHYLLYPNPYPKAAQVQKRWHASPAMVDLMAMCQHIEVRSNWDIYLQEFAQAAALYGVDSNLVVIDNTIEPMTPFERKYQDSGQDCWQLVCTPSS